ncbi:MAG: type I restriction enzyme HsdR N-terminal domain-containing protein [Methanobacteriaceae archaeon]|jgi:hypothetical protein|nr:type I restriction enzyme HsdR N-terminal domain-containing protein [Methanobacteriaceae archaeon]
MTDFQDEVLDFAKEVKEKKKGIHTEETTKIAIILPFLNLMGYDTTNPEVLKAEYTADVGTKNGEKVDLAILDHGKVNILVECKSINTELQTDYKNQLLRYYGVTDAEIGILTNGIIWQFYADSKQRGKMDETPFLELDLENPKKSTISILENFTQDKFNIQSLEKSLNELKYKHDIKMILSKELNNPSDELTRVITKQVYDGIATQKIIKEFRKLIKTEIQQIIQEKVDKKLNDALENNETENETINATEITLNTTSIFTTEQEKEAYEIIKAIASNVTNPNNIILRDVKTYCGILYKNNASRPIVRLYFNNPEKLSIEIFDNLTTTKGDKKGNKYTINKTSDLYNYKTEIESTIVFYQQCER